MSFVTPITLAANGIRLVPLGLEHESDLQRVTAAGEAQRWVLPTTYSEMRRVGRIYRREISMQQENTSMVN